MDLPPLDPKTQQQCELPIVIDINTMQALALLGSLQLALRHPSFSKTGAAPWISVFARNLQKKISSNAPGLAFVCDAGWLKNFDRP